MQVFPGDLLPATFSDPEAPRDHFRQRRLVARSEVERRVEYFTLLYQQLGTEDPLVQLLEQCLANEAVDRPSAEEAMQQLEQMDIDDPYKVFTKLDMIKIIGQKEREIRQRDRDIQPQEQQKNIEMQHKDKDFQGKDIEPKDTDIQPTDEAVQEDKDTQLGQGIQQETDAGHKEEEKDTQHVVQQRQEFVRKGFKQRKPVRVII